MGKKTDIVNVMNQKMNGSNVWDIISNKNEQYSRDDFIKDLNKMRQTLKRRHSQIETLNSEITSALNISSSNNMIQQANLDKRTLFEYEATINSKTTDSQLLHLWNRFSNQLADSQKQRRSTISGKGGIYQQQAEFLNRFLGDDEQIKTTTSYLTRDTAKGIRQDITNAYKKIQQRIGDDSKILSIKDFWEAYELFKTHLATKISLEYTDNEQGRKLLKDFSQAYMKAGFDSDKLLTELNQGLGTGEISSLDDVEILKDRFEQMEQVTKKINDAVDTEEKKRTETADAVSKDSTSDMFFSSIESEKIIEQQKIIEEQQKTINELQSKISGLESRLDTIISLLSTNRELTTQDIQQNTPQVNVKQKDRTVTNTTVKKKQSRKKKGQETTGIQEGFKLDWMK